MEVERAAELAPIRGYRAPKEQGGDTQLLDYRPFREAIVRNQVQDVRAVVESCQSQISQVELAAELAAPPAGQGGGDVKGGGRGGRSRRKTITGGLGTANPADNP